MGSLAKVLDTDTGIVAVAIGDDKEYFKNNGYSELDIEQSDIDGNWYIKGKAPMMGEEEKANKEKARIASLTCTKRVLALALKQLGVSYQQLKDLIATDEDAQLEWDLCGELLRSNPFIDTMGNKLGIDPATIDKIFRVANGEEVDG